MDWGLSSQDGGQNNTKSIKMTGEDIKDNDNKKRKKNKKYSYRWCVKVAGQAGGAPNSMHDWLLQCMQMVGQTCGQEAGMHR